jgi:hypothetical protein
VLIDACVARSFAVIGWTEQLLAVVGGCIQVADGVHGMHPEDPSELRGIRDALQRQAESAGLGSGLAGRALSGVLGLDLMLALHPPQLEILQLADSELTLAVRLQSRHPADREWRISMGARSRRLDAGEAASIAIASTRSLGFASDDDDALVLWKALTGSDGSQTRDLMHRAVDQGLATDADARALYDVLQTDDLHTLGGPPWKP